MKLLVKGKNVDISDRVEEYADKRLSKAGPHLDDEVTSLELEITEEKNPRVAEPWVVEATVYTTGKALRAKEAAHDVYAAIDLVADKVMRQVRKLHDKRIDYRHGGRTGHDVERWKGVLQENGDGVGELPPGYEFETTPTMEDDMAQTDSELRIVKSKQFQMGSLTPEEAAEQMALVGHDFFLFTNAETDETCVLYRRSDGQLGLIEPAFTEAEAS